MTLHQDKILHFAAGTALALLGLLLADRATAIALVCIVGLARELYALPEGRFSWGDLVATLLGGAVVLAVHQAVRP